MKLYKNTYDLKDSGSYQPKQMNVTTDSKYAIGVKFIKDGAPVEIDKEDVILKNGDETIEASDVYHNYAVFEMEATSDERDDKKYKVELDKKTLDIDAKPDVTISKLGSSITLYQDPTADFTPMKFSSIYFCHNGEWKSIRDEEFDELALTNIPSSSRNLTHYFVMPFRDRTPGYIARTDAYLVKTTTGKYGFSSTKGKTITDDDLLPDDFEFWCGPTEGQRSSVQIKLNEVDTPSFQVGDVVAVGFGSIDSVKANFDNLIVNQKEENIADYYQTVEAN